MMMRCRAAAACTEPRAAYTNTGALFFCPCPLLCHLKLKMLLRSLRLLSCAQYFDSAFYFGADTVRGGGITFANALAGVTHFERTAQCEYISAYRFHTNDPLVFDDGGGLVWRVGEGHQPLPQLPPRSGALRGGAAATAKASAEAPRIFTKCGNQYPSQAQARAGAGFGAPASWHGKNAPAATQRTISAVNVSTYAWVYVNV